MTGVVITATGTHPARYSGEPGPKAPQKPATNLKEDIA